MTAPAVSIVIPMYNEELNVDQLCAEIKAALDGAGWAWEAIFVNDGSRDGTARRLTAQAAGDRRLRVINLRRNFGQTAAMMAGFDHSRGAIIVPMDGDLQNDPADIIPLVSKLREGYDVVSGWRRQRQDPKLSRTLPSRIANSLISMVSGVHLHDYGCTLKAYRRDMLAGFRLYGEMHRFVPIFAHWQGARVIELPVSHRPRRHGKSNYGLSRIFKVILDLIVVKFLTQYETKPIYVFGAVGALFIALGFCAGAYAFWLKFVEGVSFILTPLPLIVMFGLTNGLICLLLGLLAEVLIRTYFESQGKTPYDILVVADENERDGAADKPSD